MSATALQRVLLLLALLLLVAYQPIQSIKPAPTEVAPTAAEPAPATSMSRLPRSGWTQARTLCESITRGSKRVESLRYSSANKEEG